MNEFNRHVVVCKNERQAKLLFERLLSYWRSNTHTPGRIRVNHELHVVFDPIDCVICISERKLFDFTCSKTPFKARIVNGGYVDRWLDKYEKQKKNAT